MSGGVSIGRRAASEGIGTALLLAAVVGSGIMGERLAGGNAAVALLANSVATGAALAVLILTFAPVSGAHFNPLVTAAAVFHRRLTSRDAAIYMGAQFAGAIAGVVIAHVMFAEPVLTWSSHGRGGTPLLAGEFVATFGLLFVIASVSRHRQAAAPLAVGAYILAAYWFTSSTSFANPAVTVARSLTDTFTGIRPADVPMFIAVQLVGAATAVLWWRWLDGTSAR